MKLIRLMSRGWDTYTGFLGQVEFKDGLSVGPVEKNIADRIAGSITAVEEDSKTGDQVEAGQASRFKARATTEAPVNLGLRRATDEELKAEQVVLAAEAKNGKVERLYNREQLEAIASEKGITALRVIAKPWVVKDRAIPGLISRIIAAQDIYLAKRLAAEQARDAQEAAQAAATPGAKLVVPPRSPAIDETPNSVGPNGEPIYVAPPAPPVVSTETVSVETVVVTP